MFQDISIIFSILISGLYSVCPPIDLLLPCTCNSDIITCGGNNELDLVRVFKSLDVSQNQKHFKEFVLNNTYINELKENTFRSITFDIIDVSWCSNLSSIHRNVFGKTNMVTDDIHIFANSKLSSPDSIFEVLSKFVNASRIFLSSNNIGIIPSNAFKPINGFQDRLTQLYLQGDFTEIGERPFYFLNSLKYLSIFATGINFIPMNAFAFELNSDNVLNLDLYSNIFIKSNNISKNAFSFLKRPTILRVDDYNKNDCISYYDEKIFQTFLMKNELNQIIGACPLNCEDCRNYWIKEETIIQKRINPLKCLNNKSINDESNFKNCSQYLIV